MYSRQDKLKYRFSRQTRHNYQPELLIAFLLVVLTALNASQVFAQQRYTLDEGGQWRVEAELDPTTPMGRLQEIRRTILQKSPARAHRLATQWIEDYPSHSLLPEAYLSRGDALVAQYKYFKALYDYEYIIRTFPASTQYMTALDREFEIGKLFGAGIKRIWLGLRILPAIDEAEELFILIQERAPGSEVAEKSGVALGDFYFNRAEMSSARQAYELFLDNFPQSRYRRRAMLRLIQTNLATFKGPSFDPTGLIEASQRLKIFELEYPVDAERLAAEALLVRVDESLALKIYYRGGWYERLNQQVSSVYMYQRVIKDYPHTVAAQAALKRLTELEAPLGPVARGNGSESLDER